MPRGPGKIQRYILLLLLSGVSLSFASFSPRRYFKTLSRIDREFQKLHRGQLVASINALYRSKLVGYKETPDGEVAVILNDGGKKRALAYKLEEMKIKRPSQWDTQWRIVIFDIPQTLKKARDAFRAHLRQIGFRQLQRSVFVHPFPCRDEIDFLIEFHDLRPFVRTLLATHIDTEKELMKDFEIV